MGNDEKKISVFDYYNAIAGYARQVENRAWTALYNFLTGNSILVLAWATLYVNPPKNPEATWVYGLMLVLPFIGFLLSLGWSSFSARNLAYNRVYAYMMETIEEGPDWIPRDRSPKSKEVRTRMHGRGTGFILGWQPVILAGTPLLFAALYVVMGLAVLKGQNIGGDCAVVAVVLIALVFLAWAIVDCVRVLSDANKQQTDTPEKNKTA